MMEKDKSKARPIGICAAGVTIPREATVKDCLQNYNIEDITDALKHEKNIFYEKAETMKKWHKVFRPQIREVPDILQLGRKTPTGYQTLIEDLKNTTSATYWEKQLGARRDVNPLPFPVDKPLHTITFGIPSGKSETVKDCLEYWIVDEPSPYDKFYMKRKQPIRPLEKEDSAVSRYDPRGIWIQCIMNWGAEKYVVADSIQADFQDNYQPKLEKSVKRPRCLDESELKKL